MLLLSGNIIHVKVGPRYQVVVVDVVTWGGGVSGGSASGSSSESTWTMFAGGSRLISSPKYSTKKLAATTVGLSFSSALDSSTAVSSRSVL